MPHSPDRSTPDISSRRPAWRLMSVAALLALTLSQAVQAEAFVPADDFQVLERLPRGGGRGSGSEEMRQLRSLRAALAERPTDLELATRLAWRLIQVGRSEGDPRYSGYAQAVLAPWWEMEAPPGEVLLLRATLRQNVHDFQPALEDLALYLERQPASARGWMTRAVVQQVSGDLAGALESCRILSRLTDRLMSTACSSGVESQSGRSRQSYEELLQALEESSGATPAARAWALTTLAEIAVLRSEARAAESHFRLAMELGGRDVYLLSAYADFLLDQDRPREVVRLLDGEERVDNLLLRLAEAEQQIGSGRYAAHEAALEARFAAARLRGETTHQGGEARFRLHMQGRPEEALRLALANWQEQKEPRDARLVMESALAAKRPAAAREVLAWLLETGSEDVQLAALGARLEESHP